MLLEARELKKSFDGFYALQGVSLSIGEGEVLGLVGESGSGKTTLAKLLAHLMAPDSGEIISSGKAQMIFQNPKTSFDPRMTLSQSMAEAFRARGVRNRMEADSQSKFLFAKVGLSATLLARYPHEISGGECQRAAIARALVSEAKLLICDEVVSSLDMVARTTILNLFLKLQKEQGLAMLFISHDLKVVRHLCDRAIVIKEGLICEEGRVSQLVANPQHPYTQELLYSAGLRPKP